jgi:hypothetical protein
MRRSAQHVRFWVAALIALALDGCAGVTPDHYHNTPTAEICRQLIVLPSPNVNHSTRMAELDRRGESCGSPADLAAAQRQKDAEAAEILKSMTPPPAP